MQHWLIQFEKINGIKNFKEDAKTPCSMKRIKSNENEGQQDKH
jgi:hypothetical protein